MDLHSIVSQHHLELGFAYWTQTAKPHLSMTQLPFNVSKKKKGKGKNPSEFVIMIDSGAQKTGSLFQNFHGCFFDLCLFVWYTWIICIVLIFNSPYSCQLGARFGRLAFLYSPCSQGFLLKHLNYAEPRVIPRVVC